MMIQMNFWNRYLISDEIYKALISNKNFTFIQK
jgi:hypothetical protein